MDRTEDEGRSAPVGDALTKEARRGNRLQIMLSAAMAILSIASAVSAIVGQEIQYRQMRAVESIADRCYR